MSLGRPSILGNWGSYFLDPTRGSSPCLNAVACCSTSWRDLATSNIGRPMCTSSNGPERCMLLPGCRRSGQFDVGECCQLATCASTHWQHHFNSDIGQDPSNLSELHSAVGTVQAGAMDWKRVAVLIDGTGDLTI